MSEPRIRYDIEASTTGQADVAALGKAMAGLDDSLPPGLQERARDLAREIQELGKARVAVVEFERLGKAARDANSALDQSQSKFDALRREIEKSGTSTQVQNGQLQKLSDALRTAKTGAEGAEQALAQARGRLEQFGQAGTKLSETGVALKSIDKMAESAAVGVRGLTTEVERIRNGQQAVQALEGAFKTLGIQGVRGAEAEIVKLRNAVAQIKLADPFSPEVQRATAAANARIAELRGTLGGVPPAAAGAAAGMRSVASSSDTAAAALGSAAHKAIAWTAAITGIGSASDVVRNVVATGSAFEDLRVRLEQLLGGTEKAAAAFDLIKNLARNTPFEVKDLTEAYVRLTSFGLKPTEQQLMALADTAAVAGGGTEKLQRVTLALGQAWVAARMVTTGASATQNTAAALV